MDKICKCLKGISRVLLAINFKNSLEETGNFVNVQQFQERVQILYVSLYFNKKIFFYFEKRAFMMKRDKKHEKYSQFKDKLI